RPSGPARSGRDTAERAGGGGAGEVESLRRAPGLEAADRQAAGDIGHRVRRDGRAQAPAQRCEPLQVLVLVEARDVGAGRIADRGTGEGGIAALGSELQVAFDAGEPAPELPIVAGLRAAQGAVEIEGCIGDELAAS